ncbi:DNA polymerase IV [Anaerofilum hominis]|uniref:DNA polymerase IV n=1 Tax=Anaerofilum hominis TaxID=2763016 RepID=UPI00311AB15E
MILHCDCNSFYASVELLEHPELQGRPVAVGRDDGSRHGVVLAKNEAAKKFGVKTAETIWQAKRKCPDLILLPPHHEKYRAMSARINRIYGEYTDLVEPFSVDESWLDVTGSLHLFASSGGELADLLRARVKRELGITISVGVSFNKVFAKLGSDYKKPDATTLIPREKVAEILWPLPVENMLFVGSAAAARLRGMGIGTIGALAAADEQLLIEALGKLGATLHAYAAGQDDAPVRRQDEAEPVKSVGNGLTFRRNLVGPEDVRVGVGYLADEVAARLRRHGLKCTALQVNIKDPALKTISRQKQLETETDLARELTEAAMALVTANWDLRQPIRAITVTALGLTDEAAPRQISLFGEPGQDPRHRRRARLEQTLDGLRDRFGPDAVAAAGVLGSDLGLMENKARARPQRAEKDGPDPKAGQE